MAEDTSIDQMLLHSFPAPPKSPPGPPPSLSTSPEPTPQWPLQTSTPILQLPREIRDQILGYLDPSALRSIRLAHRCFERRAAELLFTEIHLSPLPNPFLHDSVDESNPRESSMFERMSGRVKKLIFHVNLFRRPPIGCEDLFRRKASHNIKALQMLLAEELTFGKSTVDASNAAAILRRLPKRPIPNGTAVFDLSKMYQSYQSYAWRACHFPDNLAQKLARLRKLETVELRTDYIFPSSSQMLSQAYSHGALFYNTGVLPDGRAPNSLLGQLLKGVSDSYVNIRTLALNDIDWDIFDPVINLEALDDLAGQLIELAISLRGGVNNRAIWSSQRRSLSRFLAACKSLHALALAFDSVTSGYWLDEPYKFVLYSQIFPEWKSLNPRYASLEDVTLHGFYISPVQLRAFLRLHKPTLRHLHLSDVDLRLPNQEIPGMEHLLVHRNTDFRGVYSWETTFRKIRNDHDLCCLFLSGRLTNQWDEGWLITPSDEPVALVNRVIDYVLRRSNEYPLPRRERCQVGKTYADLSELDEIEDPTFQFDTLRLWCFP